MRAVTVNWSLCAFVGFVDRLLSLRVWIPLSNISFACYLIHPMLIILYNGKQETPIHYTDLNFVSASYLFIGLLLFSPVNFLFVTLSFFLQFYLFLGHTALTLFLGYVLTVLIEKPYLFLKGSFGKCH